ncbi:hypothetical protein [Mycobacterium paragordonae]|uniref:Uncharacterized protein n=1 Tax=Mycobacterium paragordonae TaxID=1389713 RepID=A0AAJ1SFU9_9MYCO|nr:hypothetical protein [Mycobacterium paragordonae]MDP7739467.1 hypothetical protein [Mycobacterium paragordonae]
MTEIMGTAADTAVNETASRNAELVPCRIGGRRLKPIEISTVAITIRSLSLAAAADSQWPRSSPKATHELWTKLTIHLHCRQARLTSKGQEIGNYSCSTSTAAPT